MPAANPVPGRSALWWDRTSLKPESGEDPPPPGRTLSPAACGAESTTFGDGCDRRETVEWRVLPTGQGEWLATDGNWYSERLAPAVPQVEQPTSNPAPSEPRRSELRPWTAVMVIAVVVLAFVGGDLLASSLGQHPTPSTAPGAIPGTTMTASQLNSQVRDQLATSGLDGFHVQGISAVRCNPPETWTSGATFGCYAYATSGHIMGQYLATVRPSSGNGIPQWTGKWLADNTPDPSSTTTG